MINIQHPIIKVFVVSFLFGAISFGLDYVKYPLAQGQTIGELRQKRTTVAREIERKNQELAKKRQEAAKLDNQIKLLNDDIVETEGRIDEQSRKIDEVEQTIEALQVEINQKNQDLAIQKQHQNRAILEIYEVTEQNPLVMVMGSSGLSEAVDRAAYLEALETKIESTIQVIRDIKSQFEQKKAEQEKYQLDLEQLRRQLESYRNGLNHQKQQKSNLLTNTKKTQAELESQIEATKKVYQDINSELYRLQEAARLRGRKSGSKKVGTLQISWPFSGLITTEFGESTRVQTFHTGKDIDCVRGDAILAAAKGKVTHAGGDQSYGYGLYVIIDHNDGITSLYGHLSGFEVSVGSEVGSGQTIGWCGNTGFAYAFSPQGDGTHLHFEFREDNVPVNPDIYLP